ncbi:uncharacterized protein LOC105183089 [Harpegnathos saltator]|uniref:uncharacterized protein LOC105183089 n=1 Tax=Harpegnathos saltator TaxID=610380 RepID=UPI000DBEE528|nr:uncharacterized protein LOC105183089 [Harpegnathos saltator]
MPDLWKFAFNLKNMGSYKFSVTFPDPLIANRFVTRMTKVGKSNSQPNAALYMGKKIRFSPYIQKVKRCYNCQRFGHLIAQCRGGEQGRFCASKDHNIGDCKENKNACINCIRHKMSSFNHKANDPKCPIFIECRQLKVIMAKLGLGPSDALNFYKQNTFQTLCLTKTWLKDLDSVNIGNYRLITHNRNSTGGGLAIACRNGSDTSAWEDIFHCFDNFDNVIIIGDLNCKHPIWCRATLHPNLNGTNLSEAISNSIFGICNNGYPTWHSADLAKFSAVDLTLVSPLFMNNLGWENLPNSYGSNHYPIIINFSNISPSKYFCRPHYSLSKVDWNKFNNHMNSSPKRKTLLHLERYPEPATAYEDFTQLVDDSLQSAGARVKKSVGFSRRPPSPWWDENCTEIIKPKIAAYHEFKKTPF